MYNLKLSPKAKKFLKKLKDKKEKKKIIDSIDKILNDPHSGIKLNPPLAPALSYKKCKPYRIVYIFIAKDRDVVVTNIAHRKEVYKIK